MNNSRFQKKIVVPERLKCAKAVQCMVIDNAMCTGGSEYSKSTAKVQQEYNKSTARVQQEYSKSTARVQQEYSKSTTRVQQECSKSTTREQLERQRKN